MSDMEMEFLRQVNCCVCGVKFGMTEHLHGQRRADHKGFYCTNGHLQHFTKPEEERDEQELEEQLDRAQTELRDTKDELARVQAYADQLEASKRPLFRHKQ